jgi:hypothetical protein
MKLQIDTTNKIIKIEGSVKFDELIKVLAKMFQKNEWHDFTLESNTTINNWSYPIYIQKTPSLPLYPWYVTNGTVTNLCSGTFNVEA